MTQALDTSCVLHSVGAYFVMSKQSNLTLIQYLTSIDVLV